MNVLPIGTIIKVKSHKLCIISYNSLERDGVSTIGYFVVSYPIGFTSLDKVFFVPMDAEFQVLEEGYKTETSQKFLDTFVKALKEAESVPYETLVEINNQFKEILQMQKEGDSQ